MGFITGYPELYSTRYPKRYPDPGYDLGTAVYSAYNIQTSLETLQVVLVLLCARYPKKEPSCKDGKTGADGKTVRPAARASSSTAVSSS